MRRPVAVAAAGLVIVALLLVPAFHLNPAEAQAKDLAGARTADAVVGFNDAARQPGSLRVRSSRS